LKNYDKSREGAYTMRKYLIIFLLIIPFSFIFAQEITEGRKIENLLSEVKAANPGDYIVLPSGKKYILTREEIAIVKGEFDYEDLSAVKAETLADGTEVKNISIAHVAYMYPDGQSTHILKTSVSFSAFLRHIEETYYISDFIDINGDPNEYAIISSPDFNVFRASVQFRTISDGIEELQDIMITAYNYYGKNVRISYCSKSGLVWGNISGAGSYKPTGESHEIEFGVE
jgi:hypothetical protein